MKGDSQVNSFDTQIQIEELEMNEFVYYDTIKEEYITEIDLRYAYEDYLDEDNEFIELEDYIDGRINNGTLERVGF